MTRTEVARINGAQSHGPATPEGKARSARNATTHGLNSADVLITGEDSTAFEALLASLHEFYCPVTPAEADIVFEIAANRWRLRRIRRMERAAIDAEINKLLNDPENPLPPEVAEAMAFANMAAGSALKLLHRYESRLRRGCEKAEKELRSLCQKCPEPVVVDEDCIRGLRARAARQQLQNEPDTQTPPRPVPVSATPAKPFADSHRENGPVPHTAAGVSSAAVAQTAG